MNIFLFGYIVGGKNNDIAKSDKNNYVVCLAKN